MGEGKGEKSGGGQGKGDEMMVMKTSCVITILHLMSVPLVLFGAKSVPLPALPCGELPNSEVVTNVVLNVDYGRLENLTFSLELNASASNSISIAVGTAAGDALTLDEADFEWGYDCGKWFRADTETGNVDEWPEPGTGRVSRTLTINRSDFKPQWNRLRIIKRGVGDIEVNAFYSSDYTKFFIRVR